MGTQKNRLTETVLLSTHNTCLNYVVGTQKNRLTKTKTVLFEHPKHTFKLMGKGINAILGAQTILIWTYVQAFVLCINFIFYS